MCVHTLTDVLVTRALMLLCVPDVGRYKCCSQITTKEIQAMTPMASQHAPLRESHHTAFIPHPWISDQICRPSPIVAIEYLRAGGFRLFLLGDICNEAE
jgi:hypothetical protein